MLTQHPFQEAPRFSRVRLALGFAVLFSIITAFSAFAKGGFDYIAVTGANLKGEVRLTDSALTRDFFAFADFYRHKTEEPADPGTGYENTRYYVDGPRAVAFDQLHYYPETGFVYYDGIAGGGWSEYDDQWYIAKPEMKSIFEEALSSQVLQFSAPVAQPPVGGASEPAKASTPSLQSQAVTLIAIVLSLAALLMFAFWLRKPAIR